MSISYSYVSLIHDENLFLSSFVSMLFKFQNAHFTLLILNVYTNVICICKCKTSNLQTI